MGSTSTASTRTTPPRWGRYAFAANGSATHNAAVNKVRQEPAVQERLACLGVVGGTMGADEFQKLLRADSDAAGAIVKASGARIEQGVAATM